MQDVLNSLNQALEQLKAQAIAEIQSEAAVEQQTLDLLNGLKSYIAAFRQASGL